MPLLLGRAPPSSCIALLEGSVLGPAGLVKDEPVGKARSRPGGSAEPGIPANRANASSPNSAGERGCGQGWRSRKNWNDPSVSIWRTAQRFVATRCRVGHAEQLQAAKRGHFPDRALCKALAEVDCRRPDRIVQRRGAQFDQVADLAGVTL